MKGGYSKSNNLMNLVNNFVYSTSGKRAEQAANEPLIDGHDFSGADGTLFGESGRTLLASGDKVGSGFVAIQSNLGSDADGNHIGVLGVKYIGRDDERGALLDRREIGKGEWNQDDVSSLIACHISRPRRYSRIQKMIRRLGATRDLRQIYRVVAAIARGVDAALPVPIFQSRFQFGLRLNPAYISSIAQDIVKTTRRNLICSKKGIVVLLVGVLVFPYSALASTRIFLTSGTSWTVVTDFSAANTIETIGGVPPAP